MTTSRVEVERTPLAKAVRVTDDRLVVALRDGREISVPLRWYPRLAHGRPEEHKKWELIGRGIGIHWPDLDEDISVEGLLARRRSSERPDSIKRWIASRNPSGRRHSG